MGGESVLLDVSRGTYFGLDEVGTAIWIALQDTADLHLVRDRLIAQFEVSSTRAELDLVGFLEELVSNGLAEVPAQSPTDSEDAGS
jgi:hypothetical protein